MVIHAIPDAPAEWQLLLDEEEKTGRIPLPVVDSINFYDHSAAIIALVAPGVVPGARHVFVDLVSMPRADRIALDALLSMLEGAASEMGVVGPLRTIYHAGGLDYDFSGAETIRLQDRSPVFQATAWGILRAIALIGVKCVDREASTAKTTPPRSD